MSKKVSSSKKMGLSSGNKKTRSVYPSVCKISRPENLMKNPNLPLTGGTSLDDYILDVMILK